MIRIKEETYSMLDLIREFDFEKVLKVDLLPTYQLKETKNLKRQQ